MRLPAGNRRRTRRGRDRVEPARPVGHHPGPAPSSSATPSIPSRPAGVTPGARDASCWPATRRTSCRPSPARDVLRAARRVRPGLAAGPGLRRAGQRRHPGQLRRRARRARSALLSKRRCRLGEVICLADPAAAAERDERTAQADLAAGVEQSPPRPCPASGPGLHGTMRAVVCLAIQAEVDDGDQRGRCSTTSWSTTAYCCSANRGFCGKSSRRPTPRSCQAWDGKSLRWPRNLAKVVWWTATAHTPNGSAGWVRSPPCRVPTCTCTASPRTPTT